MTSMRMLILSLHNTSHNQHLYHDVSWILVHTKPLYSNAKLIALRRNACILHDTGLEFCQATKFY